MEGYLGIDCGGSRTRWIWIDATTGRELVSGRAATLEPTSQGVAAASDQLVATIAAARSEYLGTPLAGLAGLAGAGNPELRKSLADAVLRRGVGFPVGLAGDPEIAAAAALQDGPGVAVWAGTRSFAIARATDGSLHRAGGRGWLIGDQGSGFAIVRRAAAAAADATDGIADATRLGEDLGRVLGVSDLSDLGRVLQACTPRDVAALLPVVVAAAQAGDAVGLAVIDREAAALARVVVAAVRRAGLPLESVRLRWGGGVLDRAALVRTTLLDALRTGGWAGPFAPGGAATLGAARLARALHLGEQPLAGWVADGLVA